LVGGTVFVAYAHMKLTGSKLWVAYKDYAGEDLEKLFDGVLSQDENLLAVVNAAVMAGHCGKDVEPAIGLRDVR
jgi:hypothetical protein